MKKLILILVSSTLLIFTSEAQRGNGRSGANVKWLSLAVKGGVGNSIFFNKAHKEDENISLNYTTLSYSYGGRFTFTYGENFGFGAELLMTTCGQKYGLKQGNTNYDKTIKLKALEISPFFRYTGYNSVYAEVGAKFSTVNSIDVSNSIDKSFTLEQDIAKKAEQKFTGAFIGFGFAVFKTERLDLNLGLRAAYSFTDLTPENDFTSDGYFLPANNTPESTHPFTAQVLFELNYYFAFWGDASCGRGKLMFFQ
ncbi:MAG: hypothetical protein CSB06_03190 [Bacteroidia bacterium]|nr:MAG: hypothetical protein CSB06_03190 [Bacteroidia bacterium]